MKLYYRSNCFDENCCGDQIKKVVWIYIPGIPLGFGHIFVRIALVMVRKYQDSVSVLKFYWNISTFSTFEFNARSACDLLCECAFACLRSTLSNCRFLSNNSIVVTVPDEISRLNTSTHALHSLVMDYSWPIVIMLSDGSWGGGQRLIDYRVPAQPARPTIHSAL